MAARRDQSSRWAWLPAAAAACATVLWYVLAADTRAVLSTAPAKSDSRRQAARDAREHLQRELAVDQGDDVDAMAEAGWILMFDAEETRQDRASADGFTPEDGR